MAGDEVDVDAERIGLMDNPSDDRPAVGDVPPAALDRPDHDLGYLVLTREADYGLGRIVIFYLVPAGAEVGCQLSQPVDRSAVPGQAGVADNDVDHVEFPLTLKAMRAARRSSAPASGSAVTAAMMRSLVSHKT